MGQVALGVVATGAPSLGVVAAVGAVAVGALALGVVAAVGALASGVAAIGAVLGFARGAGVDRVIEGGGVTSVAGGVEGMTRRASES